MSYQEEKSHVGMGRSVCPVCLQEHDEVVLLDTKLRKTLTRHEFSGWAMCPEHQAKKDEGYVALVEVSNTTQPTLANAKRTGNLAHVRSSVWEHLFNVPIPEQGFGFIEGGVIEKLQEKMKEAENGN